MNKFSKLTDDQIVKMMEYSRKWSTTLLSTEQPSYEKTSSIIHNLYTKLLHKDNLDSLEIKICNNTYEAWKAVSAYAFEKWTSNARFNIVYDYIGRARWRSCIGGPLFDRFWNEVGKTPIDFRRNIKYWVDRIMYINIHNSIKHQNSTILNYTSALAFLERCMVEINWFDFSNPETSHIHKSIKNKYGIDKNIAINFIKMPGLDRGSFDFIDVLELNCSKPKILSYIETSFKPDDYCFWDYIIKELDIFTDTEFKNLWNVFISLSDLYFIYPFDDVCFVVKKPNQGILQQNIPTEAIEFSEKFCESYSNDYGKN